MPLMKYWKLSIPIVILAASLWSFTAFHEAHVSAAATTEGCDPGIPYNKCHPGPLPSPNPHPRPQSQIPLLPAVPSPPIVDSAAGFFSSAQLTALQTQYGQLQIFRLGNSWILVGNGQAGSGPSTPPPAAPGGPLVAVETCSTTATGCLSPSSPHQLAAFTVVPLPNSNTTIDLEDTFANNLLIIGDGPHYGPIVLNLDNLKWYSCHADVATLAKNAHAYVPLVTTNSPYLGVSLP